MKTFDGFVMFEVFHFIGQEAEKTRDASRKKAFKDIQHMMKSAMKGGIASDGLPFYDVTEEMADDLLHRFRQSIKKASKVHHPDMAQWTLFEIYRETFYKLFKDDSVPKTIESFRHVLFEYLL